MSRWGLGLTYIKAKSLIQKWGADFGKNFPSSDKLNKKDSIYALSIQFTRLDR